MKILLHTNSLNERGTTVAILDYAEILKKLGHHPVIAFCGDSPTNNAEIIEHTRKIYEIHTYLEFKKFAQQHSRSWDLAYFIKYGNDDGKLVPGIRNIVHAVFQTYEPHGDEYLYVSKWLAKRMRLTSIKKLARLSPLGFDPFRKDKFKYLPHVVNLPSAKGSLRQEWNIPDDALVGGRHGGFDTFDIPWVHKTIIELLEERQDLYFVFANTREFINHPRVRYLSTMTSRQDTSSFLRSLDFFIHARSRGETFGLSLLEAMMSRVPVFSYAGGVDRNHQYILRHSYHSLFKTPDQLKLRISQLKEYKDVERNFNCASQFSLESVAKRWEKLLKG